jgi:outer membrane protein
LRRESAAIGVDIAKASRLPSLSIGGGVNTNYSTLALRQTGTQIVTNTQEVKVNGVPVEIETSYEAPIIGKNPYFNQLSENLGQNIGLNLQIPIYNNRQVALAIERANLNILQQDIALEQEKQQLKSDIQTAIANARAARQQLEATNKTYDAAKAAFDNADRRFQLGAINAFELTTARNNLNIAETNQVISRYDYLFKLKIIDFYQGKQIDLE